MSARTSHRAVDFARTDARPTPGLAVDRGTRALLARRDRQPDARDAMTRVFRTRSRGLVAEFAAHGAA
jgi:hypothetical protein